VFVLQKVFPPKTRKKQLSARGGDGVSACDDVARDFENARDGFQAFCPVAGPLLSLWKKAMENVDWDWFSTNKHDLSFIK
jgi:hypothetical protein